MYTPYCNPPRLHEVKPWFKVFSCCRRVGRHILFSSAEPWDKTTNSLHHDLIHWGPNAGWTQTPTVVMEMEWFQNDEMVAWNVTLSWVWNSVRYWLIQKLFLSLHHFSLNCKSIHWEFRPSQSGKPDCICYLVNIIKTKTTCFFHFWHL